MKMKYFLVICLIISLFIISGCQSLTGWTVFQNCKDVQVPYEAQESYTDSEPYTDKECHNEKLKYTANWGSGSNDCLQEECDKHEQVCAEYQQECARFTQVCVDKNFWGNCIEFEDQCAEYKNVCVREISNCIRNKCVKYKRTCELKIKNIDDTSGAWKVDTYWVGENGEEHRVGEKSVSVKPTETGSLFWKYIYPAGSTTNCKYKRMTAPTKSVCENVIKYRDVTKSRTVVKYKMEQKCS